MVSLYLTAAAALLLAVFLSHTFLRFRAHSIKHLPVPPPGSWLVGNMPELLRPKEMGDADFVWTRKYGNVMSIMGPFGWKILFTSDPKALQYILNSQYDFVKTPEARAGIALSTGKGLVWVDGMQHSRHRKIMNPAFSHGALRGFLPLFHYIAQKVSTVPNEISALARAIIIKLLENIEFLPPPGDIEIIRGAAGNIMTPMVKYSKSRHTEMPMTIKPLSR